MSPVTALATLCAPAHCRWARIRRRSGAPRAPLSAPRGPRLRCAASDAVAVELRDDDVLPDSLYDAVVQGGQTTATAIEAGNSRCLVEIQVPELFDSTSGNIMAQEGDQQRVWEARVRCVCRCSLLTCPCAALPLLRGESVAGDGRAP